MTPAEQMTGEELAARLFAEQGYLVLPTDRPSRVGDIRRDMTFECQQVTFPVRVIGDASISDIEIQRSNQKRIAGDGHRGLPWHPGPYFYRVEAAD